MLLCTFLTDIEWCLVYLDKEPNIICTQVTRSVVGLVVDGVWSPVRSVPIIMLLQYSKTSKETRIGINLYFHISRVHPTG